MQICTLVKRVIALLVVTAVLSGSADAMNKKVKGIRLSVIKARRMAKKNGGDEKQAVNQAQPVANQAPVPVNASLASRLASGAFKIIFLKDMCEGIVSAASVEIDPNATGEELTAYLTKLLEAFMASSMLVKEGYAFYYKRQAQS